MSANVSPHTLCGLDDDDVLNANIGSHKSTKQNRKWEKMMKNSTTYNLFHFFVVCHRSNTCFFVVVVFICL